MQHAHLSRLPPEVIVKILKELDEQSLGRLRCVSRYFNAIIEKHRSSLAKPTIYMAVFKEKELIVERYLRRSRWEDYKYAMPGPNIDSVILRQLHCANIETLRFQMAIPDEVADELVARLAALKSSVYAVCFSRCQITANTAISLLLALKPQQVSVDFDLSFGGITMRKLCEHSYFKEMKNLSLINSRLRDNELLSLSAEHLTVYERSEITLDGLRRILVDWYNGKRVIRDYHLSVSERIVPERLFYGLPTRQRSIIAWEMRNSDSVLHVSVIGPGVSILKVFDVIEGS